MKALSKKRILPPSQTKPFKFWFQQYSMHHILKKDSPCLKMPLKWKFSIKK